MSAIYNLEPQPTGSVILHTSQGELAVELFAKQTPLTCRNFIQLCLDGYYDNTIFHRLVPGFILQGGDPTGSGNGGESIYDGGALSGDLDPWPMDQRRGKNAGSMGVGFKDEFHTRLKFNRRGLLGMANDGTPDTNNSQFFFTLGKADELNGRNTMFGRIEGDTIYNLAKMGEAEVDEANERPLYPVKILRVEILVNPFPELKRRERIAPQIQKPVVAEKKKKRKGGKQLLSFGDEEGDAEELPTFKKKKYDTRIVMDVDDDLESTTVPPKKVKEPVVKQPKKKMQPRSPADSEEEKEQVAQNDEEVVAPAPPPKITSRPLSASVTPEPEPPKRKTLLEQTNAEIAALKASMRRNVQSVPEQETKKSAIDRMMPETSIKGRKRRSGAKNAITSQDQKALDLLKAFQSKLNHAQPKKEPERPPAASDAQGGAEANGGGAADEEAELCDLHFIANCQSCRSWDKAEKGEESDDEGWMSHALSFAADKLGKDLSYRKKAEEELVVIDPREKARTLKEEKKAEREARAGNTGRAWDQARNAQMTRDASFAGRGAR